METEEKNQPVVQCASDPMLQLLVKEPANPMKDRTTKVVNDEVLEISSLLKVAITLNYNNRIETWRIYDLLGTHLEPNGKISLLSIKRTLLALGYNPVGGLRPRYFDSYLDSRLKGQKQAILLLTSQKMYALATDMTEQGMGILYGTGDYCWVPKVAINQFFKTDVLFLFDPKQ